MARPWATAVPLLLLPLASAAVLERHDAELDLGAQDGTLTLAGGDIGSAVVGASGTSAEIQLAALPLLVPDDLLRLGSSDAAWRVHAVLVSQSGWTSLGETVTLSLADGSQTETQVQVSAVGGVVQGEGPPVDAPTGLDTQLRAVGAGTGSLVVDLVLRPDDAGSPRIQYRVSIQVG